MTVEEMKKRWPIMPPNEAGIVIITEQGFGNSPRLVVEINQDTIEQIIEYFQAAKEAMNG